MPRSAPAGHSWKRPRFFVAGGALSGSRRFREFGPLPRIARSAPHRPGPDPVAAAPAPRRCDLAPVSLG